MFDSVRLATPSFPPPSNSVFFCNNIFEGNNVFPIYRELKKGEITMAQKCKIIEVEYLMKRWGMPPIAVPGFVAKKGKTIRAYNRDFKPVALKVGPEIFSGKTEAEGIVLTKICT